MSPGDQFKLSGGIADFIGIKGLSLKVEEKRKESLRYRFSAGYICKWSVPKAFENQISRLLEELSARNDKAPKKVFIAISTYKTRHKLIQRLKGKNLSISISLQKSSIIEEVKFLDPDIIFIEKNLTEGANRDMFAKVLSNTRGDVPIFILDSDINETNYLHLEEDRRKSFIFLGKFRPNFQDMVMSKLKNQKSTIDIPSSFYISSENQISFAELNCPTKLLKIHPESIELATPFKLVNYCLISIDSALTKKVTDRNIYGKIINSFSHYEHELQSFPFMINCYLSDLLSFERSNMTQEIINRFENQLSPFIEDDDFDLEISEKIKVAEDQKKKNSKVAFTRRVD